MQLKLIFFNALFQDFAVRLSNIQIYVFFYQISFYHSVKIIKVWVLEISPNYYSSLASPFQSFLFWFSKLGRKGVRETSVTDSLERSGNKTESAKVRLCFALFNWERCQRKSFGAFIDKGIQWNFIFLLQLKSAPKHKEPTTFNLSYSNIKIKNENTPSAIYVNYKIKK